MQRRRLSLIFTCVALAATTVLGAGGAGAGVLGCNLANLRSNLNVDVEGGSTADGAPIIQWEPHDGTNQVFTYDPLGTTPDGEAVVRIRNVNSNKVLDVFGGSTSDGAPVVQWTQHDGDNQIWVRVPTEVAGIYVFVNVHSLKVLDVLEGSLDNGAPLIQWTPHGGDNQVFEEFGSCGA